MRTCRWIQEDGAPSALPAARYLSELKWRIRRLSRQGGKCNTALTILWRLWAALITLVIMSGHLPSPAASGKGSRFWPLCQAFLALGAAGTALAIPGPTGELCGIAAILAVAGLARLAGHRWGTLVAGVAATLQLAHVWPVVKIDQHSGLAALAADATFLLSALLALGFAVHLPRRMPFLLGRRLQGGRTTDLGLSAAVVMMLLILPAAVIEAPPSPALATASSGAVEAPVLASADRADQPVSPRSLETVEREVERGRGPSTRLDGDAKAVAADASQRDQRGPLAADGGLDAARLLLAVGDDEASRGFAEGELVDALSGAAWKTEIDAEPASTADRALGQRD